MDKISKGVNVLMLGSDMRILLPNSEPEKRMVEYGMLVSRLDIVLFNGRFFGSSEEVKKISFNTFVHPRSFTGLLGLFKVSFKKLSFVLNHRVDLITSQDPFVLGFISWRLARWLRASLHVQVHTDFLSPYFRNESIYNRIKVGLARFVLKKADGIRVVSGRIRDSIKKEIKIKTEPFVLPIWTDVQFIKNYQIKDDLKKKYSQFETVILMASRITIEKNIRMVIVVMGNIVKRFPKTGLVIVGDGPLKNSLESMVDHYGLSDNIKFELWSDDLSSYYKTVDLFINSSNYEGYGRTIVESLAAGTPVITTNVGCAEEVIRPGENGFVVSVNVNKEMESVLVEFLGDPSLREKLKDGAVHSDLHIKTKEEYLEMYARSWNDCLE